MKHRAFLLVFALLLVLLSSGFVSAAGYWDIDTAYTKRHLFNCTYMDDGTPIISNSSTCFEIDGKKQCVWTYCSGTGTALYKHNSTDYTEYIVANDTAQIPFEVEFGNGTSYNPSDVYGSEFIQVLPLGETSGAVAIDSTGGDGNMDITGVSQKATGKIGYGYSFDGSYDYIQDTTGSWAALQNFTYQYWVNYDRTKAGYLISNNVHQTTGYTGWNNIPKTDGTVNWFHGKVAAPTYESHLSDYAIQANTWTLLTFTLSSGTLKWYINGTLSTTDTGLGDIKYLATYDVYRIGKPADSYDAVTTHDFKGSLDNVWFSNDIKSADFINQTYQNAIGTSGYGDLGAEESAPASEGPTVTAHTTSPSTVYTNTDFKFNMTATDSDNVTINAYVQFYVNGTASGATQSQAITNNTNTLIGTLSSSDFGTGASLIAEYWASDGINSTTKANQSTVTVQSSVFSISINSPADDTQTNNNTPGFSFTVSGSPDTYSCSLFLNDSSYGTNSSTLDSTATIIIASTIPDGIYNWYVNCTFDLVTNQSEIRTIRIDVEAPAINTNFINNSAYLQNTITGQFNFTDNILLHSLNISIDDSAIYTNESIAATFFQYNLSIDPATLSNGIHELFIRIADGHTAIQLKNPDAYNPSNGIFNNYARYSIRKPYPRLDITMYLKDQSVFDSWELTKKSDRYSETLRPYSKQPTQIFIVESDQYIHIVNDPKGNYKGQWLIIGDHWKDFVLKDEPGSKVSIKRITDNKVEVTISGIKNTKELIFDSTGDLNIVTKTYNFYVSNSSISSPDYSFETDIQTITFFLNKTGNVSTNAELYWNSTFKESTKTSYSNYDKYTAVFRTPFIANKEENITGYWDYNITDGNTESNNITFNQTAYRMSIDTCSEYTAKAINFTLMDEVLNEPLTIDGEIHAAMQLYRSNISDYRTTNLDYTGSSNYSLCIYPSWANYTIDFTNFEYMADGYANREYSTSSFGISNNTQEIKLYLINLSDSTNVIMSLRDTDDNVLEGYNIRVKRYYPATGEEVTSEISRTDYNGQAIARLVLYNYYYSFSIEELDGTVIKLISPSKIYSNSLTFVVDVEEEELNFEDKVWYSISPDSPVQSQPVNFSLTTISPGLYIEWFAIETRFNSTDYLDNSTDADGGTVTIELNLTNQTGWISITYYIQAANETLLTFERGYLVTDIVPGDHSIEGQKGAWENIFNVMWRVVAAVLISIIAVLLLVPFIGPESAGIVGVLVQIVFTMMGWIPLWMIIVEAVILIGLYLMSNRGAV